MNNHDITFSRVVTLSLSMVLAIQLCGRDG